MYVYIFCNILQESSITFFEFATNIICFSLLKKLSVIFTDRITFRRVSSLSSKINESRNTNRTKLSRENNRARLEPLHIQTHVNGEKTI